LHEWKLRWSKSEIIYGMYDLRTKANCKYKKPRNKICLLYRVLLEKHFSTLFVIHRWRMRQFWMVQWLEPLCFPTTKFISWNITPDKMMLGGGTFGRQLDGRIRLSQVGLTLQYKVPQRAPLSSFYRLKTQWEDYWLTTGSSPELSHAGTLILVSALSPEWWEVIFCL
jgi:hypothetical protein